MSELLQVGPGMSQDIAVEKDAETRRTLDISAELLLKVEIRRRRPGRGGFDTIASGTLGERTINKLRSRLEFTKHGFLIVEGKEVPPWEGRPEHAGTVGGLTASRDSEVLAQHHAELQGQLSSNTQVWIQFCEAQIEAANKRASDHEERSLKTIKEHDDRVAAAYNLAIKECAAHRKIVEDSRVWKDNEIANHRKTVEESVKWLQVQETLLRAVSPAAAGLAKAAEDPGGHTWVGRAVQVVEQLDRTEAGKEIAGFLRFLREQGQKKMAEAQ